MADTIEATCQSCGHQLTVVAELAGKRVRCPACKEPLRIPQPKTAFELDIPQTPELAGQPATPPQTTPPPQVAEPIFEDPIDDEPEVLGEDIFEVVEPAPTARKSSQRARPAAEEFVEVELDEDDDDIEDYDDFEPEPPTKSRSRSRGQTRSGSGRDRSRGKSRPASRRKAGTKAGTESNFNIAIVIVGVLMIVGSIVWTVIAWNAGYIMKASIGLGLAGIVTLWRGIFGTDQKD